MALNAIIIKAKTVTQRIWPIRQNGAVLFIGLMFLLILTLLGITTMNATSVNARLTQNLQDSLTAFTAAESALGSGEAWLKGLTVAPVSVSSCATAPCNVWKSGVLGNVYSQSSSWWAAQSRPYPSTQYLAAAQPRFVIEEFRFVAYDLSPDALSKGQGYYLYRVTAQGTGETAKHVTTVQSIYATQFN